MSFFYEFRSPDNSVLKRNGGFINHEAASTAALEDAKRMKLSKHLGVASVGTILVGQNVEKPMR